MQKKLSHESLIAVHYTGLTTDTEVVKYKTHNEALKRASTIQRAGLVEKNTVQLTVQK